MKKKLLSLVCIFSSVFCFSQAVKQGDIIIDGYYGFPNLFSVVIKTAINNIEGVIPTNIKIKSVGPFGLRFEYLLNDKIGVGLEGNYTNTSATWLGESKNTHQKYFYEIEVPRYRIMPRFNFHFVKSNEQLDGYFAIAAGYLSRSIHVNSNDPKFNPKKIGTLIPVAFKVAVGLRYLFTDNIGANMEVGLGGGPLIAFGLSAKFGNGSK
ncbi:MAG: hypothetical protein ABI315_15125 [Bacteroidia bacterium]